MKKKIFVDPINGNDKNSGLTQNTPKKTLQGSISSIPENVNLSIEFSDKFLLLMWLKYLIELRKDDVKVMEEIQGVNKKLAKLFDLDVNLEKGTDKGFDKISVGKLVVDKYDEIVEYIRNNMDGSEWKGEYSDLIKKAYEKYGIRQKLLASMIKVLSDFNPEAVSLTGSKGLMMLSPTTIELLDVKDPFDPEENIMAGAKYMSMLLDHFLDLKKALAAYYAGPKNVEKGVIPKEAEKFVNTVVGALFAPNKIQ